MGLGPLGLSFRPWASAVFGVSGFIGLMIEILHFLGDPGLWGITVYSVLWVMQDLYHHRIFVGLFTL